MRVKWYMRVFLVFHPFKTTVSHYTRSRQGLKVTLVFKEFDGKQYVYKEVKDLYNLKGKHNRIARRKRNVKAK